MTVDYDLVVIGNTPAGVYAAIRAATLQARVALVEQRLSGTVSGTAAPDQVNSRVLQELGRAVQQVQQLEQLGIGQASAWLNASSQGQLWQQASRWAKTVNASLAIAQSPATLSSLGIEVISGVGEFYRKPTVGFVVDGRRLRSRAYLLAMGCRPAMPTIDGGQPSGYFTVNQVLEQPHVLHAVEKLVVLGTQAPGIEIAQAFAQLGAQVTVISTEDSVLPTADAEISQLLQAQLEAAGIEVLTGIVPTQIRQIEGKKWVQAGRRAIETDAIVVATGWEADVDALNLAAVDIEPVAMGVTCNAKQQTAHPRIYTCTSPDTYAQTQIEIQRAHVAVNNALFFPIAKFSRTNLPLVTYTNPEVAQVGMTETQALQTYGKNVWVLRSPLSHLDQAQITGNMTGLCKLIAHRNGTILGAHLMSPQASEIIGTIALAMQRQLKISSLANLAMPSTTFATIIREAATEWYRLKRNSSPRREDLLAWWFDVVRSWS